MYKGLHSTDGIDRLYMCREKEEEDEPSLKIASMHRYDDTKTT